MNADRPLAIRRSAAARSDLREIWRYIAEDNPPAADHVIDEIERVCHLIAAHPRMGREREEILPGLRSFAVMSWVIFYRIDDRFLDIMRVVHGARDLDNVEF